MRPQLSLEPIDLTETLSTEQGEDQTEGRDSVIFNGGSEPILQVHKMKTIIMPIELGFLLFGIVTAI